MNLSIIIPTHNRANQLFNVLKSISKLLDETSFEVIVVDNNSNDKTYQVVKSYVSFAKYFFEESTAFTKARMTGAQNATGKFLLYLDDDVIVKKGSLKKIIEIFESHSKCAVIAGKISPLFVKKPQKWALECQKSFNAWSLFDGDNYNYLKKGFQEVNYAIGPMMAVRKNIFFQVGGFPPDTIGVETNNKKKTFRKLYVGPGDVGLCYKIKKAGHQIAYHPLVSALHVIPEFRLKVEFFRSRMIGEAHYVAITQRRFFLHNSFKLFLLRIFYYYNYNKYRVKLLHKLKINKTLNCSFKGIYPEELHYWYFKSILEIDVVLRKSPTLSKILWDAANNGIKDKNYEKFLKKLPNDFMKIINSKNFYSSALLDSEKLCKTYINENFYSKYFYVWVFLGFFIRIIFYLKKILTSSKNIINKNLVNSAEKKL